MKRWKVKPGRLKPKTRRNSAQGATPVQISARSRAQARKLSYDAQTAPVGQNPGGAVVR
jgi:hypothetical protein